MTPCQLSIPLVRAAAWFEEEPADSRLAVSHGVLDSAWGEPVVGFVEPLQRRRLSRLARGFFHCAKRVSPVGDVRLVFASRHGEAERTLAILQDLAAQAEVSPTLFSMSVHNAVPGLWSILEGNRAPISAVAAGPETFGWGLVEALAAFRAEPSAPVLYVYADDRLPACWAQAQPRGSLHALALLLGEPAGQRLTMTWDVSRTGPDPATCQSIHFLRAWAQGEPCGHGAECGGLPEAGPDLPWVGPGGAWCWQLG